MKLYKKESLTYKDGYLITGDGDVVAIDNEIVDLANTLEERVQRASFLDDQPEFCAGPDLTQFKRMSEFEDYSVDVITPLADMEARRSVMLMDELDNANAGNKVNEDIAGLQPLLQFAAGDSVMAVENAAPHRFDLPALGNPLELTPDIIKAALYMIHDYHDVKVVVGSGEDLKKLIDELTADEDEHSDSDGESE